VNGADPLDFDQGWPTYPDHEDMVVEGECPRCGDPVDRDSVDVGVGTIYGPWGCCCGWSEHPEYDAKYGRGSQYDAKGGFTTTTGVYYPEGNIVTRLMRAAEKVSEQD
jgi:hypothetical protein